MTASSRRAGLPLRSAAVPGGTHRLLPAAGPRPRDGCDHRDQHEQPDSSVSPDVRPFPAPYLIPAGTTTSDGFCPVSSRLTAGTAGAAAPQHNRHPGRPPRIRTTTFPLRPPRLRDDPAGDDGLYLREQAHPDRPASYAVRVPRCRDPPRASFPPASRRRSCLRLGVSTTSSSRGLSPPSDRPCRAYSRRHRCAAPLPALPAPGSASGGPPGARRASKTAPVLRTDPCDQLRIHAPCPITDHRRSEALKRIDSNGDSNSSDQRQRVTLARSVPTGHMSGLKRHPRSLGVKRRCQIEGSFPGAARRLPRRRGCGS